MPDSIPKRATPRVVVIADVESNAKALITNVLTPTGIQAWTERAEAPPPDVLVVDMTQLRGDPLAGLRARREQGDEAPAIALAAHFPPTRLRELFRLGVRDIMLKPYRPPDLCQAIYELSDARTREGNTAILARRLDLLRERIRRQEDELRLMGEIGRAVATLGDLDTILTRVAEAAAYVTDAEETHIYLAEPGTDQLVLRASKEAGEQRAALQRLRVTDTLVGQVFRTGQPVLRQPSIEGGPVKVQTGFLVQSLMKVPLRIRSRTVGVLGAYNRLASRRFDEHHLTLLRALADWASVALEHAFLLQQAKHSAPAGEQVIVAGPAHIKALERASAIVDDLLGGGEGPLGSIQTQRLQDVRQRLSEMRAMPLATLNQQEATGLVNLPELVRQAGARLAPEAERRALELILEPMPLIPLFPGDPGQTRRVLEALMAAAISRTRQGRVVVRGHYFEIRLGESDDQMALPPERMLPDGQWAAVSVADTSSGLSPDTVRALTAPRIDPGAGQETPGLSMGEARMIAESLRAHLWHEQTAAGTEITFAIPIA
jgi:GAF domain-containing protein/AmiR/NasT family two-component response regulator